MERVLNEMNEGECAICYEKMEDDKLCRLHCNHAFHEKCILEWMKNSTTCPMCRSKIEYIPEYIENEFDPYYEEFSCDNCGNVMIFGESIFNIDYDCFFCSSECERNKLREMYAEEFPGDEDTASEDEDEDIVLEED